jgi:hypothetical protein
MNVAFHGAFAEMPWPFASAAMAGWQRYSIHISNDNGPV